MLTASQIFRDSFALMTPLKIRLALWVAVLTGTACLPFEGTLEFALLAVTVLLTWLAQLDVTIAALCASGSPPHANFQLGGRRFFAMMLLTTVAILASVVLLVVPAILLMVRWWIAVPFMFDKNASITGALGYSWRETRAYWRPITLAFLAIIGMFLVGFLPMLLVLADPGASLPARLSVGNMLAEVVISVATILTSLANVAVYRAIGGGSIGVRPASG